MKVHTLLPLAAAALLAACAGTPGPGEVGYPFNLEGDYTGRFVVEGQSIDATMTLATLPGGAVEGSFRIPMMGISGSVEGTLVGDQLSFRAPYHNPDSGCDGIADASATVTEGGGELSGSIDVQECGQFLSGSLRFSR